MFIYSFRASTLRFFALLLLAAGSLTALILFVPAYEAEGYSDTAAAISYEGIETNEDRIAFLGQFGYKVSGEPIESVELTLPDDFDRVFSGYNELQKAQGLDLAKYKGKRVKMWSYGIRNYPGYETADDNIRGNILVYDGIVVGGDISNIELGGFTVGFAAENQQ